MEPLRLTQETLDDLEVADRVAILTLAWALRRGSNERFLLSATIDVVGQGDASDEMDRSLRRSELSANYFLFARRYVLTAADGLAWYHACATGNAVLPAEEAPNAPLSCQPLLPEPPWPGLQVPTSTFVPGSCWTDGPGRTASLIPDQPGWELRYWTDGERRTALAFLQDAVSFDFEVDPEYLGGAHIVAADPDLLDIDFTREGSVASGALLRVTPTFRSDRRNGFTFTLYRHRPKGAETRVVVPLTESSLIELPHQPFCFSWEVTHEKRGLVWRYENAVFLDGFGMELGLVLRNREVVVPAVRQRPVESFAVPVIRDVERISSAPSSPQSAARILASNRNRQEKRRPPYQRWFDGSADEAAPALREILANTREQALVVDPYFDHVEFVRFGLGIGRALATLRILTSAEGLRSNASRDESAPGEALARAIEAAGRGPTALASIEVRVMSGSRPEIHDRFVVADDWAWLLGSSLNEFGSRGTVLVALPDPDPVIAKLDDAWNRAEPLGQWVARRTAAEQRIEPT